MMKSHSMLSSVWVSGASTRSLSGSVDGTMGHRDEGERWRRQVVEEHGDLQVVDEDAEQVEEKKLYSMCRSTEWSMSASESVEKNQSMRVVK